MPEAEEIQNQSVQGSAPPAPPSPPAPPKTSGPQIPDFLKQATASLKNTQKQEYLKTPAPGEAARNPDGSPIASTDTPAPEQGAVNMDSIEEMKAQARVWVFGTDFIASRGLAWYSMTGAKDDFKMDATEKSELESALVEYFKTMPSTPKMPPWLALAVIAVMIFGAKAVKAQTLRKEAKKKPKKKENEITSDSDTITGRIVPITKPTPSSPVKPKAKKASLVPKRKKPVKFTPIDPSKPYWEQARDGKGRLLMNPVSEIENNKRKDSNGQICLNCNSNYCKKGKNACSTHCAGKLKLKNG